MRLFAPKDVEPNLVERLASAAATREAALSVFQAVLDDLRAAEAEALDVSMTAAEEVERLRALAASAEEEAAAAAERRVAIAQLLGL